MTSFNATVVGQPYDRVQRVIIDYPAPNEASVIVQHQQHVPLNDGTHCALGQTSETRFQIGEADMDSVVALFMPGTDTDLQSNTTNGALLVGLYSVIREKMLNRTL